MLGLRSGRSSGQVSYDHLKTSQALFLFFFKPKNSPVIKGNEKSPRKCLSSTIALITSTSTWVVPLMCVPR